MNIFKTGLLLAVAAVGLSGCSYLQAPDEATLGGPRINDNVFLLRNNGVNEPHNVTPSVIPRACRPGPHDSIYGHPPSILATNGARTIAGTVDLDAVAGSDTPNYSEDDIEEFAYALHDDKLNTCVDAMRQLIDQRFARFEHVLNGSLSTSNFLVDATITGLATSIPLVAPGTKSVLGAIAAGLSGTRKNFDEDVLYSYSIQMILQQMRADRAAVSAVIEAHLTGATKGYRNMYQAEADLFEYSQAGSWDHAMASLQTNTAASAAACLARLRNQKLEKPTDTHADGQPETSTTTDPCNSAPVKPGGTASDATDVANGFTLAFDKDANEVKTNAADIAKAADLLKKGAVTQITIAGTTTSFGGDVKNKPFAIARAADVKNKLVAAGADATKITVVDKPDPKDLKSQKGARITFTPAPTVTASETTHPDQPDAVTHALIVSGSLEKGTKWDTTGDTVIMITQAPDKDGNLKYVTLELGTAVDETKAVPGTAADLITNTITKRHP